MIKSIGNFFSDYGWGLFFAGISALFIFGVVGLSNAQHNMDEVCLQTQQVVVKYNGAPYCADLNSLIRVK
jgi:type II secretory pathway component PulF